MATRLSTIDRPETDDGTYERERDLLEIDDLIIVCRSRLHGVSDNILSAATKNDTSSMYERLRKEAEDDTLRAERLAWMRDNVEFLQRTIEKAARESAEFSREINEAAAWLGSKPAENLRAWFFGPDCLEMYRSMWFQHDWQDMKARGKKLLDDRTRVLETATAAGIGPKDVPALAIVNDANAFSNLDTEAEKRTLLLTVEAHIIAAERKSTAHLRRMETLLTPYATGTRRCLHPAKLGAWLKKIALDPETYTAEVLRGYAKEWQSLRAERDAAHLEYESLGKPDGCAPPDVLTFLEMPVATRKATLEELRNRLNAARATNDAHDAFATELRDIRRSVDLNDLDAADLRLAKLRSTHPTHSDVVSIRDHIAVLRKERDATDDENRTDTSKTIEAFESLRALQERLPTAVASHYAYVIRGTTDQATTFFHSMKIHADRVRSGKLSKHEAHVIADVAGDADDATIVEHSPAAIDDDTRDESLLVSADTHPASTIALLRERGAKNPNRSPGVVFDLTPDQHLQLVALNMITLAHMRHLERMGTRYNRESAAEALAA